MEFSTLFQSDPRNMSEFATQMLVLAIIITITWNLLNMAFRLVNRVIGVTLFLCILVYTAQIVVGLHQHMLHCWHNLKLDKYFQMNNTH